jgi:hypothetical protein
MIAVSIARFPLSLLTAALLIIQDFRIIRLGDLNLLQEIDKQDIVEDQEVRRKRTSAVVRRAPVIVGARRIHRARIYGSQETVTAVVYEGSDFEKVRRWERV